MEDQTPRRPACVEVLCQRAEGDPRLFQPFHNLNQVAQRSSQPIQTPHNKRVSFAKRIQAFSQLRAIHCTGALLLFINPRTLRLFQRRNLPICPLILCRDTRIPNYHKKSVSQTALYDMMILVLSFDGF